MRDVGRTELGTERYGSRTLTNGKPSAALAVRQAPGANALATADAIKAKMEELSKYFPPGMKAIYPNDTTPFVKEAIKEVVKTLFEAVLLVFLVMYLFLGNIRATLIPTLAVPVVILGTFAVLGLFGFSINMLTMFAMVLAIGLLVDDAIVVVENVERVMSEEGLSPREATRKSMDEITSALIGIGLVLSAVFGPMAFFSGSTGVIYRQFSVTVIAAMLLSVVVALILTPVLCASLLKPVAKGHEAAERRLRPVPALLPLVRPGVPARPEAVRGRVRARHREEAALPGHLRPARGGHGLPLPAHAHGLPPQRGSGHPVRAGDAAHRFDAGADRPRHGAGAQSLHGGRKGGGGRPASPWPAGAFRGPARTWGSRSSSSRTGSCASRRS